MIRISVPGEVRIIAGRRRGLRRIERRGVSSVLSMMFLVLFGSLAAAMAVVAQGNLRTADSSLKVSRALSAAETGLAFAARRLESESRRFITTEGVIDTNYADDLWSGNVPSAELDVLPPVGYTESTPPSGLMDAIFNAHTVDASTQGITPEDGDEALPIRNDTLGIVWAPPIAVNNEVQPSYFRLKYQILATHPYVRVTSQGVDGNVTRTLQMDFRIDKKIEFAVISPSRIMIGKNVRVEGPIGTRYGVVPGELSNDNGDPLVMRSDFYYLDGALDTKLDTFFTRLVDYDVDGDGRLRPDHPVEVNGLGGFAYLADVDGNEYVDDFDIFVDHYDSNGDGRVVYDATLAGASEEFTVDKQMARLIDEAVADRDGDGAVTASDNGLGYQDGVLDINDLYTKVRGRLAFAVARAAWEASHGANYQTVVHGPVTPGPEEAAVKFAVTDEELLEITTAMLDSTQTWFYTQAQAGADFGDETTGQVLSGISAGGTYVSTGSGDWESVPWGSQGAYDYYQRPLYEDMEFSNVRIPKGTNGLFRNCTFIGVTWLETNTDCDHENWNYAGALEPDENEPPNYQLRFPDLEAESGGTQVPDTRVESNNIRFENCTFIGSLSGDKPNEYTHWRNKVQMTGTTRFFIDPTDPDLVGQPDETYLRNKLSAFSATELAEMQKSSILLPGWSVDVGNFDNTQASDPADTPVVKLKGTIIGGILDARGTVEVDGTLMMTFRPVEGQGPLFYGGQTDAFNTTIGYFGPTDGDGEGMDPSDPGFNGFGEIVLRYDPNAKLPDGIPWPVQSYAVPSTYFEGGSM